MQGTPRKSGSHQNLRLNLNEQLKIVCSDFNLRPYTKKITVISRKMLTNLRVRVYESEIF